MEFGDAPVEAHVARTASECGLAALLAAQGRNLPAAADGLVGAAREVAILESDAGLEAFGDLATALRREVGALTDPPRELKVERFRSCVRDSAAYEAVCEEAASRCAAADREAVSNALRRGPQVSHFAVKSTS